MPVYAEIWKGRVVGVALAENPEVARKRFSISTAKELVELPEMNPGWSIEAANHHLFPLPLAPINPLVYDPTTPRETMTTEKTLHNSDISGARVNVKDIKVVGNGDMFALLCKASSQAEGWMKSTKAMQVEGGVVVQVTTQQRNPDGSYALAEALTYVPGSMIAVDENGGRKLVPYALD